jgi:hypothetical protein
MKYYVGSRTAKKSHVNDGYICSSRVVKPMIVEHPNEWARTIVGVGTPEEMYQLETEILQTFDCKNDPRSFNKSNNEHPRGNTSGMKGKSHSEETRKQMSESAKLYCADPEVKKKRGEQVKGPLNPAFNKPGTMLGKKHTPEALAKISASRAGKTFGPRPKHECPTCSKMFSYLKLHICYGKDTN